MSEVNFENKIRYYLKAKNMSIKELCKAIGMSQQNLDRIFKANSINSNHLLKISTALGIEPSYFFLSDEQIWMLSSNENFERVNELRSYIKMMKLSLGAIINKHIKAAKNRNSWTTLILLIKELGDAQLIDDSELNLSNSLLENFIDDELFKSKSFLNLLNISMEIYYWTYEELYKDGKSSLKTFDDIFKCNDFAELKKVRELAKNMDLGNLPPKIYNKFKKCYTEFSVLFNEKIKKLSAEDKTIRKLQNIGLIEKLFDSTNMQIRPVLNFFEMYGLFDYDAILD